MSNVWFGDVMSDSAQPMFQYEIFRVPSSAQYIKKKKKMTLGEFKKQMQKKKKKH